LAGKRCPSHGKLLGVDYAGDRRAAVVVKAEVVTIEATQEMRVLLRGLANQRVVIAVDLLL